MENQHKIIAVILYLFHLINTVAIGIYRNDGNAMDHHVRIYTFNGNSWQQLGQDIDGEASGDFSGISLSLSADGNTVAIELIVMMVTAVIQVMFVFILLTVILGNN